MTAVNSKAGTLLSSAASHSVDTARTKGPLTCWDPLLEANTATAPSLHRTFTKANLHQHVPRGAPPHPKCQGSCTHHPGVSQSPFFSITMWDQALLLLEAAHVLVWACTSPMFRYKPVHELFKDICKISFENCKILIRRQAGNISNGFITSNEPEE